MVLMLQNDGNVGSDRVVGCCKNVTNKGSKSRDRFERS
jgi:hypothetical protein